MKKTSPHLIAFMVVAIDLLGFGIVLPLLPRYAERFKEEIPPDQMGMVIGALMSSFSLMQFLFAPWWGKLSDRIGRRPVLLVGLMGSVVFYGLFAIATLRESLFLLFVSRIGQGIAGATIATAQAVIADCTPPEKRAKSMALIGMAFGIGFTFGPLIGALTVMGQQPTDANLTTAIAAAQTAPPSAVPGFVASGICLAGFVLAVLILPETHRAGERQPRHWLDLQVLRYSVGHAVIAVPMLTFFLAIFAFAQFEGTISRFTKDVLNYQDADNFWIFVFIGMVLTLAQGLLVRRLVPRVGEVAMTTAGAVLMLIGLGGMGLAALQPSSGLVLTTIAVAVIGFACLTPSVQALVSRRASAEHQGEILGGLQSVGAIARIVGPFLGNVLYGGREAQHALPYWTAVALMAMALGCALAMRRQAPQGEH